jgi:hypothetical protein
LTRSEAGLFAQLFKVETVFHLVSSLSIALKASPLARAPIGLRVPHGDEAPDFIKNNHGATLVAELANAAKDLVEDCIV